MEELVVLVNESNQVIGTAPKSAVHTSETPLHRGFSVFLFDRKGYLLLQQRGREKTTWPLVWSNSCCGHPLPEESNVAAARRRLRFELGISDAAIYEVVPDYRYRAERDGVVENEICAVLVAFTDQAPALNRDEVEAIGWVRWPDFIREVAARPEHYSVWCVEEVSRLNSSLSILA